MRARGPTLKVSDFPSFNSENPNPAIRFALYRPRNGAQSIGTLWRDERPAQLPERQFHAHAPGKCGSAGRTNGMPWDGTSPINESTLVEIGKSRPVAPRNLESRLAHMWRSYAPNELVIELLGLSNEIRPYSSEIADDVAWLASVAWERAK
jgi:hypothetical protein